MNLFVIHVLQLGSNGALNGGPPTGPGRSSVFPTDTLIQGFDRPFRRNYLQNC